MQFEVAALAAPIIFVAYMVFGMTGFGAAIVAVPVLVQLMPLHFAVPLVVLFDLVCTSLVGGKNWRKVSRPELVRMLPWLLLGVALGVTLLSQLPPKWPLIALGVFVLLMCARNLLSSDAAQSRPLSARWSMPFGTFGGVFSALFGTGGPIYTIYLSRRLPDVDQFRATISVLILLSGITRAVAFSATGLYSEPSILRMAAVLLPVSLLGVFAGSRLRTRFPAPVIKRVINLLLVVAGIGVLYRGLLLPS